jgi:hypothetical protein
MLQYLTSKEPLNKNGQSLFLRRVGALLCRPVCDFANTVFRGIQQEGPFGYMNLNFKSTCLSEVSNTLLLRYLLPHAAQSVFFLQLYFPSDFIHDILHRFFLPPEFESYIQMYTSLSNCNKPVVFTASWCYISSVI